MVPGRVVSNVSQSLTRQDSREYNRYLVSTYGHDGWFTGEVLKRQKEPAQDDRNKKKMAQEKNKKATGPILHILSPRRR